MSKYPVHLGEEGTEQFSVRTYVNGQFIREQKIHDPFIRSTTRLRGFGHAWRALFGGIKVEILVNGSEGASRAVMTLDPVELQKTTEEILEQRRLSREAHARGDWLSHDRWYVIADSDGRGPIVDVGGKDYSGQIAEAKFLITDPEIIEANARLIAAAPELLEAGSKCYSMMLAMRCCAELREIPEKDECEKMGGAMKAWVAAIKKATGEEL